VVGFDRPKPLLCVRRTRPSDPRSTAPKTVGTRQTGNYVATVEGLRDGGAKAPKVTDDLEASEAVRDILRRYEEGSR